MRRGPREECLHRPGLCVRSVQSPGMMPAKQEYTPEFKSQAVRFVLQEIEPDEARKQACDRLAPRLSLKAVTLYNWVKQSAPAKARPTAAPGSVEELRALNAALRIENRELARANAVLSDTAAFLGRHWRCGHAAVAGCRSITSP